jgi:hypothetical protein
MQLYKTITDVKKYGQDVIKTGKDAVFLYNQYYSFSQLQFLDRANFLYNKLPEIMSPSSDYSEWNKIDFLSRVIGNCLNNQLEINTILEGEMVKKFLSSLETKSKLTLISSIEVESINRVIMDLIFPIKNTGKIILKKNPFVEKKKPSFFESYSPPSGMQVNKIVEYYLLGNKIKELKCEEIESSFDGFLRDEKILIDHKIKFLADLFDQSLEDEQGFTLIKTFRLYLNSNFTNYKNKYKSEFIKALFKNEDFSYNFEIIFDELFFDGKFQSNQKETTFLEIEKHKTGTDNCMITQRF